MDNLKSWEVFEEKKVGFKRLRSTSRFPQNTEQTHKIKFLKMYTTKIKNKWKKQSILPNKFLIPFLFHGILAWECWEKKKLSSTFMRKQEQFSFGNAVIFYSCFLCRLSATRSWTRQMRSTSASRKYSIWLPDQRTTRSGITSHRARNEKRAKQGRLFFCNFPFRWLNSTASQVRSYFDTCKQ